MLSLIVDININISGSPTFLKSIYVMMLFTLFCLQLHSIVLFWSILYIYCINICLPWVTLYIIKKQLLLF